MLKLKAVSVLLVIAGVVCWRPNLVAHKRLSAISSRPSASLPTADSRQPNATGNSHQLERIAGSGWEPDRRLTFDLASSGLSYNFARSIAADDLGGLHVVWYDTSGGGSQVYSNAPRISAPTGVPTCGSLTASSDPPTRPSPSQGAWFDRRDGNSEIYYKRGLMVQPAGPHE